MDWKKLIKPSITMVRLQPVVDELKRMNGTLERLADLYELQLQQVNKLTTRVVAATPADLMDTRVAYNDPELADMIDRMEREAGVALTEDELERVIKAWNEETGAA